MSLDKNDVAVQKLFEVPEAITIIREAIWVICQKLTNCIGKLCELVEIPLIEAYDSLLIHKYQFIGIRGNPEF